jgi:hypothetical protein
MVLRPFFDSAATTLFTAGPKVMVKSLVLVRSRVRKLPLGLTVTLINFQLGVALAFVAITNLTSCCRTES